ncbi:MAG: mismatch repair protein MutS [Chitinophagaceae bacterium]|nr:mismatch repair protein MutS [Chitinophagaceae bacterium]
MQVDKTTLEDISIFHKEEELSVLHHLNFTRTAGGKEWLRLLLGRPLNDFQQVLQTQQLIQNIISIHDQWPETISNGTIMVMERFYETQLEPIPAHPNPFNSISYKIINGPDFSLLKYSVEHFISFLKGIHEISHLLSSPDQPLFMQTIMERMKHILNKEWMNEALSVRDPKSLNTRQILQIGNWFRRHFKNDTFELIDLYTRLDAYYSLATACKKYNLQFPKFIDCDVPHFDAKQLYHLLLPSPVAYDVTLNKEKNFLFLTGANMAGKSTFIKAVGVAAYMAHIGMGVPAASLELTLYDGLLSNIHVEDNLMKGESYFFNEVQRIRKTVEKISDGRKWMILIDELFKGTNVEDAMKCSTVVIEGLRKIKHTSFILSTHLYEIGQVLRQYPNIQFRYFQTDIEDEQLIFNYQLHEGISKDRIGYLILKREGVVKMLNEL